MFLSSFLPLMLVVIAGCGGQTAASGDNPSEVRLGYFPNLTHAVAIVGIAQGSYQKAIGEKLKLKTTAFNAGPSLIEALFAGDIDIGYVGPNPAVNGYIKSHGDALAIIAGASSGGALLVVRPDAHIQTAKDLANKKIASPQVGGTQDVALRYYLQQNGLQTTDKGGNVQVVPTENPNILSLFKRGELDGAWVPEPWASRLIVEGKGRILVDERQLWPGGKFATTIVVVRKQFLTKHPDLVRQFLQAHVETVLAIQKDPSLAKRLVNEEIKRVTGKPFPAQILDPAYARLDVTYDPLAQTIVQSAERAYTLGFLGQEKPKLEGIFQLQELNTVLRSKGLEEIAA
ncbi:ABC transporter substrate-binding protein [Thermosporothrix hazakensis]|jgi:NitT/TauT family transport system substrate-binding protein|nr:ABC transporter substrate-binding protein [Thermosporothrix hazakensis]BBH88594.1 lipoprotein [Thermosporothrix sp. COM3]GCE46779.1 lipoprotein [Thermosporothrix hazakensis]